MPKAWDTHKAELIRLYITEGRTLKDVQGILRRRHGFKASTRAYRMKIDEWRLLKYKASHGSQTSRGSTRDFDGPTPSKNGAPVTLTETSGERQVSLDGNSSSAGPENNLKFQQRDQVAENITISPPSLKDLLLSWQAGGDHLQVALKLIDQTKFNRRLTDEPSLFMLAERIVLSEERFTLMKALLEADLEFVFAELEPAELTVEDRDSVPPWVKYWRSYTSNWCSNVGVSDWNSATQCLTNSNLRGSFSKDTIYRCFRLVIAERILKQTKTQLEKWRGQIEPLTPADSSQAECCRQQYMLILRSFYNTKAQLDPTFYKYAVQIYDWDLALMKAAHETQRDQIEHLLEKGAKYQHSIPTFNRPQPQATDLPYPSSASLSISDHRNWAKLSGGRSFDRSGYGVEIREIGST